jgi:hypothetical protein
MVIISFKMTATLYSDFLIRNKPVLWLPVRASPELMTDPTDSGIAVGFVLSSDQSVVNDSHRMIRGRTNCGGSSGKS